MNSLKTVIARNKLAFTIFKPSGSSYIICDPNFVLKNITAVKMITLRYIPTNYTGYLRN